MKAYFHIAFLGLALAAPASAAEVLDFTTGDPEATSIAEKGWASSIEEAKAEGQTVTITGLKRDLNGDGKPEIVGQVKSTFLCGNQGPCVFVMATVGADYDVVFSVPGIEKAEILDSKTQGWSDIQLNEDDRYQYNGTTYKTR